MVTEPRKLVVIGNGMAGMQSRRGAARDRAQRLRHHRVRRRAAPQLQPHPALARARRREASRRHRPAIRSSGTASTASRCTRAIPSSRSTGAGASCDPAAASKLPYDRLLLATGSKPIMLPVPGNDCPASSRSAICRTSTRCCSRARTSQGGGHRRRTAGTRSRERPAQAGHGRHGRAHRSTR